MNPQPGVNMTDDQIKVEAQPEKIIRKCVGCSKEEDKGFFLINSPVHLWEFEGDIMCFECYVRLMVKKAIDERISYFGEEPDV